MELRCPDRCSPEIFQTRTSPQARGDAETETPALAATRRFVTSGLRSNLRKARFRIPFLALTGTPLRWS